MNAAARALAVLGLGLALAPRADAAVTNQFRLAVPWPPGSKGWSDLQSAARDLARKTEGRVQVKFAEQDDLDSGPVPCDGALLAGPALARRSPAARTYSLPLLFRTSAEALRLRGRLEESVAADLDGQGLTLLALPDLGFAYLFSRAPVDTPAQLKSVRLWVPAAEPEALRLAESQGMTSVPLSAAQVRDALRQGEVDVVVAPPLGAIAMQWHVEIRAAWSDPFLRLCAAVVLRQDALARLADSDQALVRTEWARAFTAAADDLRNKEDEALAVMAQSGTEFRSLGDEPARRAEWESWASAAAEQLASAGQIPRELLEEIRQTLAESRAEP